MLLFINIDDVESYKVHKHFAKHIHHVPDYLVKSIGESEAHKKLNGTKKIREGKTGICFKKIAAFFHLHLVKRRTKKRLKNKHREKAESI